MGHISYKIRGMKSSDNVIDITGKAVKMPKYNKIQSYILTSLAG